MPPPTRLAEQRYATAGLVGNAPAAPLANYVAAVEFDGLVFTAGNGPLASDGSPAAVGILGDGLDAEAGAAAARVAATNLISSLRRSIGSLDRVAAVCQLRAYLRCAPGFDQHDAIAAAAADVFDEIFGTEVRSPVPTVISVTECVLGLPVTIDAVLAVDQTPTRARDGRGRSA